MNPRSKTIALVTGATGGLGTAMCQKLYQDGYTVVANYRNEHKGSEWHTKNKEQGFDFNMVQGDVTDFEDMRRMMEEIKAKFGGVSILINNAGITRDTPLWKMSLTQWHEVISSNLDSVFNCTRHVIEDMIEQKFGRIINISSVNGQRGQFGQTNYSSAKAGMHGFTKSLAMEVAKKGITVNTISPGYIGTDMVMAIREEVRNKIVEQIPMGRLGGTEEIAHLVSFLASEKAAYITGANYAINGGQHVY
ncbi:MAG: acetoacetyl-CoA reductase [Saprospiraceae bacterium]|uniref:Acetoacetyl-CoA reductase n=1 Tax=Candidatus Defluviibacterium haderslevense TaxID=2981993 RepID=A0A9D7S900_9BACT|nr:acetoacetyl-CoA reductase [Candidatus Defluviibacterium haderslevense]MBK7244332.1 acetoacetyl-CoA reductase [Candidatus Defluviibacterium haderslevense]MBK8245712.1 acetoacetyl-CoA reductase [Candidatus Defluviibacterium haderslevense]MBK9718172.1 acetoacetyl-CoA reductase [Candidatus Defluviibacterium haderslevense]MBL0237156.1 acetoacetyl-CoA reductase [Candidatus Defluviibacterium haderslevense]